MNIIRFYTPPKIEIVLLNDADVIATSSYENEWNDENVHGDGWLVIEERRYNDY